MRARARSPRLSRVFGLWASRKDHPEVVLISFICSLVQPKAPSLSHALLMLRPANDPIGTKLQSDWVRATPTASCRRSDSNPAKWLSLKDSRMPEFAPDLSNWDTILKIHAKCSPCPLRDAGVFPLHGQTPFECEGRWVSTRVRIIGIHCLRLSKSSRCPESQVKCADAFEAPLWKCASASAVSASRVAISTKRRPMSMTFTSSVKPLSVWYSRLGISVKPPFRVTPSPRNCRSNRPATIPASTKAESWVVCAGIAASAKSRIARR